MSQELYDIERLFIRAVASKIRYEVHVSSFDHRQFISPLWAAGKPEHMATYEVVQGRLIHAIGKVLNPKNVLEVGIGPGITAHSLLSACPEINYFAIDNAPDSAFLHEFDFDSAVRETFDAVSKRAFSGGGSAAWLISDSDSVDEFKHPRGEIDLIHIDGDHSYEHQRRDVEKAIRSGAEWLLVDDCNDTEVVTSVFRAWENQWRASQSGDPKGWRGGLMPMIYFEDSRTGSLLFHSGMWKHT